LGGGGTSSLADVRAEEAVAADDGVDGAAADDSVASAVDDEPPSLEHAVQAPMVNVASKTAARTVFSMGRPLFTSG
jgi:hypothetical protein